MKTVHTFVTLYTWNFSPALCISECDRDEFSCRNGACIPLSQKCDFFDQCGDFSDEMGCGKSQLAIFFWFLFFFLLLFCFVDFSLLDKEIILGLTIMKCFISDCGDETFKCNSTGICIDESYVCDGFFDCHGRDDEKSCSETGKGIWMA